MRHPIGADGHRMIAQHANGRETMNRFIIRENIKHYLALLERTTDQSERAQISTLLAEEQRKQKECDGASVRIARLTTTAIGKR
jgi:hypothetical protein